MLSKAEIFRRLRAYLALPRGTKPIPVPRFAELAGLERKRLYTIAGLEPQAASGLYQTADSMQAGTQAALSRAFTWLENDQVNAPKGGKITIKPPAPPCVLVRRLRFDDKGFRIEATYENPRAFPER